MFCRCKKNFAQLFYASKKAKKTTFSHKNHKTTCFVMFLSGGKKKAAFFSRFF